MDISTLIGSNRLPISSGAKPVSLETNWKIRPFLAVHFKFKKNEFFMFLEFSYKIFSRTNIDKIMQSF